MKNIKRLAAGAVLGLAICRFAIAQSPQGGATGHADGISAAQHIAEVFAKVAAFDRNKDGQLDATEKESLAKAIADGTLQLPAHTPPHGEKPNAEMILTHITEMYAHVAKYDANHDGALDEAEQTAITKAIEAGELHLPHGQHAHGGDQPQQ